jgi:hypothetical protein
VRQDSLFDVAGDHYLGKTFGWLIALVVASWSMDFSSMSAYLG